MNILNSLQELTGALFIYYVVTMITISMEPAHDVVSCPLSINLCCYFPRDETFYAG